MNRNQIEGRWSELRGEAKRRWARLTDDDLAEIDGDRQTLIGRIQARYGDTKQDVERAVERWQREVERPQ